MNDKKTSVRTLTMLALLVAMSIVFSAEHDAHGYQQSQHGQGTHRSFFVVHCSCPP